VYTAQELDTKSAQMALQDEFGNTGVVGWFRDESHYQGIPLDYAAIEPSGCVHLSVPF
jgi:hypothetical protein